MRLKPEEIDAFVQTLSPWLKATSAKLYLYGSRADDALRGGDIDLLLIVTDVGKEKEIHQKKHVLLNEFKKKVGDQRIDFTVTSLAESKNNPFIQEILPGAVLLKEYAPQK